MHLLLHLLLLLWGVHSWQHADCPTDSPPGATARRALQRSDLPLARACLATAYQHAPPASPKAAKALRSLQQAQLALLQLEPPADAAFERTWWELMALMEKKSIMNLPELDALAGRWDVYLLHGQLACLEETGGGAEGAVRSLAQALALRESGAVRRLLARVSLGRGELGGALRSATAARRAREAPADSAAALLLQFQALALWQARLGGGSSGNGSAVALGSSGGLVVAAAGAPEAAPGAEEAEGVWEEVRDLIAARFEALGVALPASDPLRAEAPPPFLALQAPLPGSSSGSASRRSSRSVAQRDGAAAAEAQGWMHFATPQAAQQWAAQGYTVVRGLLPPAYLAALRKRHLQLFYPSRSEASSSASSGGLRIEPDEAQRRRLLWDEEISLYTGTRLLPAVSAIVGLPLTNTYVCSIAYERGGDLKPHVDREQNAISLSLNLGLQPEGAEAWPLYVAPEGRGEEAGVPVRLAPGDGLLYGGPRHTHFRYPLTSADSSMQVIFGFRGMSPGHCNSQ